MKIKQEQTEGKPLWEGHRARLRQRMEREGWEALKPYEMVELVLYHAVPRQDLSDISRLLVDRFGSVGGVFGASPDQLSAVPGMTPTLAEWIGLTGELIRAYRDLHAQDDIGLSSYRQVSAFLTPRLDRWKEAGLWVLYADFNYNLITYSAIEDAAAWWDAANARHLLVEAIGNGARYLYVVIRKQAVSDGMTDGEIERLNSIAATLRVAGLDLVDCLLADDSEIYSLNLHGKMEAIRAESGCMKLHEQYGK